MSEAIARRLPLLARHPMLVAVLFWVSIGLLYVPQQIFVAAVRGSKDPLPVIVLSNFGIFLIWALFTPAVVLVCQRWPMQDGILARRLGIHVLAALVFALVHIVLQIAWLKMIGRTESLEQLLRLQLTGVSATNIMLYALTAIAAHSRDWWLRSRELDRARAEAQLTALRGQLDPHFLFNTLNALAELAHQDAALTEKLILRLSELLRRSLGGGDQHQATLAEELDFLEGYLDIQRALMGPRLRLSVQVPAELRGARVPRLLLQPLVENAIRHGLAPKRDGGEVEIRASLRDQRLLIQVNDNGIGVSAPHREGIGLGNLRRRLDVLYGDDARLEAEGQTGRGFEVRVHLPFEPGVPA